MPFDIEKILREEYSMLNSNESRLCCLLFFEVSNKNIAKILPYKQRSIRATLYKLKQKIGIDDMKDMYRKIIVNIAST